MQTSTNIYDEAILSLDACFTFTSREYILQHLAMTVLKRKNDIFNNHNINDNKTFLHGSKNLQQDRPKKVFAEQVKLFVTEFAILICQNFPD